MTTFERLLQEAKELERHHNTDWAEEHAGRYDDFATRIEDLEAEGALTPEQFKTLALTAFYDCDYDFDE